MTAHLTARRTLYVAGLLLLLPCSGTLRAEEADPAIDGKPLSELVKQLKSENKGLQLRAAKVLVEAPAELRPKMMPRMMELLKSERENDKYVAALVLGQCGPAARAAVPDLLPMLEGTQYERNRAAAAKALGLILKDAKPDEEVEKVAQALAKKFNEDYDKYPDVRREAACALGMIGPAAKSCVPKLTAGLTDFQEHSADHFTVRMAAAWAAGRMGPASECHMDRLLSMLNSEIDLASAVVWAIGEIGPVKDNVVPNVTNRLEKALIGAGFRVGAFSYRVGPMTEGTLQEYLDCCFATLAKFGPKSKSAVPLMNRCISEGDWTAPHRIRSAIGAFKVLRAVGPEAKEALPAIEKALQVKRFDDRIPAATVEEFKKEAQAALESVSAPSSPSEVPEGLRRTGKSQEPAKDPKPEATK
jgi:hypothetical protein